jgi:hypothetical protein
MSTTGNNDDDDDATFDYHEHDDGGHNHVTTHDHHGPHHHDRWGSVIYYPAAGVIDIYNADDPSRTHHVDSEPDRPHRATDNPTVGGTGTT